jgi:hypothetical protein
MQMHSRLSAPSRPRRRREAGPCAPPEALENRTLLAALPAPEPEAQINTFTRDHQRYPSVAADAAGNYIVTWESYQQEDLDWNIYAQRFTADGTPLGTEFRVNQDARNFHTDSSVAMDDEGNFVVVWTQGPDAFVWARRFSANGKPLGDEFVVDWAPRSGTASVAMNGIGEFVVAWDVTDDNDRRSVFAQYYLSNGNWLGVIPVSTNVAGNAGKPDVAIDADGDFMVTFEVVGDPLLAGTYARRFERPGRSPLPAAPETLVSTDAGGPAGPAVAMSGDGSGVVTWSTAGGIYGRVYEPLGLPQGPGFLVEATPEGPRSIDVAAHPSRNFIVTWCEADSAGNEDVWARGFGVGGELVSGSFRLNTYTLSQQANPSVVMTNAGGFISAWNSWGQDGNLTGVFARKFASILHPATSVVGRRVFYNRSAFDGNSALPGPADDAAVATNKVALMPGGSGSFLNVTSYARGINGVMVDVADLPDGVTLSASDFAFRSGTTADRSTWTDGPAPMLVSSRQIAPGRQRVTVVWRDYNPRAASTLGQAVANGWLEVTLKATPRTNLAADDVFCFGNLIGETGGANPGGLLEVNSADIARVRASQLAAGAAVTNLYDFNRDGRCNVIDLNLARWRDSVAVPLLTVQRLSTASSPAETRPTASVRNDYATSILG